MNAIHTVCNSPDLIYEILNRMSIEREFSYSDFLSAYATCKLWKKTIDKYPQIERVRKYELANIQSAIRPNLGPMVRFEELYRNNLKNRNLDLERATIAKSQGANENPNSDFSSCFDIKSKKLKLLTKLKSSE